MGLADIYYRDHFTLYADVWLSSIACRMAAIVSSTTYVLSVIFPTVVAVVRCYTIKSSQQSSKSQIMKYVSISIWIIVLTLSFIPLVIHAFSKKHHLPFSGSLCLSIIPSTHPPWVVQAFSITVNIVVLTSVVSTLLCYIIIMKTMISTKRKVTKMSNALKQKRGGENLIIFTAVVTITNLLCWMPVCAASIMNINGYYIPQYIMNIIVIVALPFNSLMHPCLYTIRTDQFQEDVKAYFKM